MLDDKTIFALSSGGGKAGISVIRISGKSAGDMLLNLGFAELPEARKAVLKRLKRNSGEVIDEALVLWFPAPASFTGEDVVELHVHGSIAVIADLTEYFLSFQDLRMAEAGEFSQRAFDNGKFDLTAIEGLADLIDAETKMQKKQALRQMSGELEALYDEFRQKLIKAMAYLEAYIDFPDEEIPAEVNNAIDETISELLLDLKNHVNDNRGEILRDGVYATIIGAPNVGKSSLLNYLAKRDVAIVSNIAGTTRDALEVHLDINGYPLILADTAGIRDSSNEIEAMGIAIALERWKNADFNIVVFSADNYPDFDKKMLDMIDENTIILLNKCDLYKGELGDLEINGHKIIAISVKDKSGIDDFIKVLENKIGDKMAVSSSPSFTRERHKRYLRDSIEAIERFIEAKSNDLGLELCTEDLRLAAVSLGKITGKIDVEDILDEIFSSFCIGK